VGSLLSKLIILVPYSLFLFPALFPSMPLFLCTALELLPMMGQISIFPTMLAIGADRVLSIFFPLWFAIMYLCENSILTLGITSFQIFKIFNIIR
jgi:hypothetical protein